MFLEGKAVFRVKLSLIPDDFMNKKQPRGSNSNNLKTIAFFQKMIWTSPVYVGFTPDIPL